MFPVCNQKTLPQRLQMVSVAEQLSILQVDKSHAQPINTLRVRTGSESP